MARLFETILGDWTAKSPRCSAAPPNSRYQQTSKKKKKPACLPSAPKIDYPNFTNIETCPKSLSHRYTKFSGNPIDEQNSKLSDRNSNFQLLFARTTDKLQQNFTHKNHSFMKILFTIKFHS